MLHSDSVWQFELNQKSRANVWLIQTASVLQNTIRTAWLDMKRQFDQINRLKTSRFTLKEVNWKNNKETNKTEETESEQEEVKVLCPDPSLTFIL